MEAVTINSDQLRDIQECPLTTTTTTTPPPSAAYLVEPDALVVATPARKTGRPPDLKKQEIVEYVRELRKENMPWKNIPDAVFEKFQVRYTAETLRGYLKNG
jgi:hypothetical protein